LHGRKAAGADIIEEYIKIAKQRIELLLRGKLKLRPMGRPIYEPKRLRTEREIVFFDSLAGGKDEKSF